jgi:hypothetical protein
LVMEERRLLSLDLNEVMDKASEKSKAVLSWLSK